MTSSGSSDISLNIKNKIGWYIRTGLKAHFSSQLVTALEIGYLNSRIEISSSEWKLKKGNPPFTEDGTEFRFFRIDEIDLGGVIFNAGLGFYF